MSENLDEVVEKMARLSQIAITDEERKRFANALGSIISHFAVLEAIDTSLLTESPSVCQNLSLREDEPQELLSKEAFLKNAPSSVGGLIRVPPVLKP